MAQKKSDGPEDIDKIREILFGAQVREHQRRFAALDKQLQAEAENIRKETKKRFDALDKELEKQVAELTAWIEEETEERIASLNALTAELEGTARSLSAELTRSHKDAMKALDNAVKQLTKEKTDRVALSTMFTEFAARIGIKEK
jgi:exonuclease VII large subunit